MLPLVTVRQQLLLVVQQLLVCLRGIPAEEERERKKRESGEGAEERSRGDEEKRGHEH